MNKIYDFYEKNHKIINIILGVILFLVIFLSIYTTPLYDDDLVYINKWRSEIPLENLYDIYEFQIAHYFNWGGRTVAHTILQLLLLCPKFVSALLNTIILFVLAFLINKVSMDKIKGIFYLFTIALLYYLNPTYKESVMWLTGSANYLYTTTIILISMIPLINIYKNKSTKFVYLYLPIVFLAGWCNENMSATLMLFIIVTIVYAYKRKIKANWLYLYLYLILEIIGLGLMLLAPGNFVRASDLPGGLMGIMYRGHGQLNAWFNWLFASLLLVGCTTYYRFKKEHKISDSNLVLLSFSIISMLAMLVSPVYPQRATFGTFVILMIVIINNIYYIYQEYKKELSIVMLIIIIGAICSLLVIGVLAYARMFNPTIGY